MAAPATSARERVSQIVEAEFSAESVTVESDKIPRAAGRDGRTRVACSPNYEAEVRTNVNELEVSLLLQYYLPFVAEPDEHIAVDPTTIEAVADRLRRAFRTQSGGMTADMWFLRLRRIDFPDDPTGNKSRLEAQITAWCENPAALG
jgi:hypothetical protein